MSRRPSGPRWCGGLLALVLLLTVAACGGGGSGGDDAGGEADTGPTEADLAAAIAFHSYDFPAGWTEVQLGGPEDPKSIDRLKQCLGPVPEGTTAADKTFHYGPGVNSVASVRVWIFPDAAGADAIVAPTRDAATFDACLTDAVRAVMTSSLGPGVVLEQLAATRENVTLTSTNGVGIDFLARVSSPSGPLSTYPAAAFVQKGRAVAAVTVLSNNLDVRGLRRQLTAAVVGRMPSP